VYASFLDKILFGFERTTVELSMLDYCECGDFSDARASSDALTGSEGTS